MPEMRFGEYQRTIQLKVFIIMRMFGQLTNQIHYRFSCDVTGRQKRLVDLDVAERRKRLEVIV